MIACFGAVEKKIMTPSALLFASYAVTQLVPYDSDYIFITEQHKNHFVRKKNTIKQHCITTWCGNC